MKKILRFLLVFAAMFCMTCFTAFAEDTDDPDTYYLELDAAGGQLSGETSTVISSPSAEFTTVDLSKYKPEKDGFTFTGWYNDKTKVTSIDTSYFQSTNRIKLTAMYTKDSFSGSGLTFTLNANGGKLGDADSGTYDFDVAGSGYGVALNDYPPTREGYEFKGWNTKSDGSGKTVNIIYTSSFEKAADNGYEYSDTDDSSAKRNLVFYAMWKSDSAPTGTISMGDKSWNGLQDVSSFEQYYNKTQKVTITCDNNSDPSITVGYLISDSALSSDDLGAATFTEYKKAFSIKDEGKYVVYAKLSSEDGKTTYLSTDGEQTIIVSDKAGNETKLTVTINKKHTAETDDGDCTTPQKCRYCGEIVVEGKSSHDLGNWTSDGNGKTHSRKCKNKGCGYKVIQDCSGGTATCQKKAVCSVCGKSYGKLSTTNHTDLKKTDYVAATTSSKGNIEYWYCSACKKYFSNKGCTKEISKADTVIDKAAPEIIGGKGSKWSKASKNTIKFRSNAEYADFVCVLIDDKELDPSYYNKKEGSIIIELKTSYLESLSVGSHTITIRSKTGDAVTTFTVSKKETSATTQTTTRATTEATTASTTEVTTEYRNTFTPVTTEATTTEISTIERTTTETTTEVTTEKSTLTVGSYSSTDKSKSKVHNLQLIILITVLATILISFVIIIISGMKKK